MRSQFIYGPHGTDTVDWLSAFKLYLAVAAPLRAAPRFSKLKPCEQRFSMVSDHPGASGY